MYNSRWYVSVISLVIITCSVVFCLDYLTGLSAKVPPVLLASSSNSRNLASLGWICMMFFFSHSAMSVLCT